MYRAAGRSAEAEREYREVLRLQPGFLPARAALEEAATAPPPPKP
jgi:hypothetical protein